MSDIVISVENLSKQYIIGHQQERYYSLRDTLSKSIKGMCNLFRQNKMERETIWALKNINLEIKQGEVVGIIGRNGAGKTTLLKVLSRITDPSEGRIRLRGRVGSLLEVGTGFHPELTGRENIYLNGTILGMKKAEIERKFDEIVAFAEVEKFLDTQVKFYSSGMHMRLAFSVAAHLEPEILLVDEVLAVGDAAFQKKCLGKMGDVAKEGRTVLFVSHNMGAIKALCLRGIWIDVGRIAVDGDAERTISRYLDSIYKRGFQAGTGSFHSDNQLQIIRVMLKNKEGKPSIDFAPGDDLTVEIHYYAPRQFHKPNFWIGIVSQYGPLFAASMLFDGHCPGYVEGQGVLSCTFRSVPLIPQTYTVRMGVRAQDGVELLTPTQEVGFFNVVGRMKEYGFQGELAEALSWSSAPILIPYEWHLPDGRIIRVDGFSTKGKSL